MKKGVKITALVVPLIVLSGFVSCGKNSKVEKDSEPTKQEFVLNDKLLDKVGKVELKVEETNIEVKTTSAGKTLIGNAQIEEILLDGGEKGATLTATGWGVGAIQPLESGKIIFKNITIIDNTDFSSDYHQGYLEFGGQIQFIGCIFTDSIYLKDGLNAKFINCEFNSPKPNRYAVWVADGSASFENCTFTGYRGLKIHEEGEMDVSNVVVDTCYFYNLEEKPGLAIGNVVFGKTETCISIKNSNFENCQDWDTVGSIEGMDGFYESDTRIVEFLFVCENNIVNGEDIVLY